MLTHRALTPSFTRFFVIAITVTLAITAGTSALLLSRHRATPLRIAGETATTLDERPVPKTLSDRRTQFERAAAEEQRARTDILVHALRHEMAVEGELVFTPMAGFDEQWNLYYGELATADGAVAIYTAVDRRDPSVRFATIWDRETSRAAAWERAQD